MFFFRILKDQRVASNGDNVLMFEPVRVNQLFVDKRAVFTLQVNEHKSVVQRVDLGMMS